MTVATLTHAFGRPAQPRVAATRQRRHSLLAAVRRIATERTRSVTIDAAGLGLLSASAWTLSVTFGLAAAGLAVLVIGWRVHR